MKQFYLKTLFLFCALGLFVSVSAQQLAFPGAEGFGRFAKGGRGGAVYHVTNLNDAGPGSFRDAVSQPNRIVVFDVGGVIKITERVVVSKNITIAGQTAHGEGITIYGNGLSFSGADNTICRYIRVRMGVGGTSGKDAIGIANGSTMIFDHVSVSWGRDETFSISWDSKGTEPSNITIQNSIIGQGLQTHSAGGLIQTNGGVSIIKCLYIDNKTRNPKVKGVNQFVNNVVYNWGGGGAYIEGDSEGDSYANIENNYFIKGPSSGSTPPFTRGNSYFHVYVHENYYDNNMDGILNGEIVPEDATNYAGADLQISPYNYPEISRIAMAELPAHIIANVGAVLPSRDQVDTMLINQLKSFGTKGSLITSEKTDNSMVGPGVVFGAPAKTDTDQDGMPDSWEDANGLDKNNAADANTIRTDGWSNLEFYINNIKSGEIFLRNPVSLTAVPVSESQVNLSWQEYSDNETGFIIQRSTNNKDFVTVGNVGADVKTYPDNGLVKNTIYYYRVRAENATMQSVFSPVASAKTLSNIPINPVPVSGSAYLNPVRINFSWTAGAISYKFYLGTDPANLTLQADNLTTTSYTANALADGQKYYWRVDAVTSAETLTGDVWEFTTRKSFPLGLAAHWKMDETSGETASDFTDYNNDGTLVNLDNSVWEPGISANSLNFTGSDATSHIEVPHSDALYFDNNPFSIAMWVKIPATQGECYLIHKGSFAKNASTGATGKWFGIQVKTNLTFAVDDDVTKTNYDVSKADFATGQWIHLVAIRDTLNKKLLLYKNGIKYGEKADATKNSIGQTEALFLGNSTDANVPFRGSMDDVRLYNYALSENEITDLYNSSVPLPGVSVNPSPVDNYGYADIQSPVLTWAAGSAASSFDVYFGTDQANLSLVSSAQTATSYKVPQVLNYDKQYYWRIDSKNFKGVTTGTVWSFKTQKSFPKGLVAKYRFEETSGTAVADSSDYLNHGTLTKVKNEPLRENGHLGKALSFTDSSYVAVPFKDQLYFNKNPFSVSLWMKIPAASANSSYLFHKGSFAKDSQKGTNGKWYGMEIKGASLYFAVDDDASKSMLTTTSTEFCTGDWVHVVAIRDTVSKLLKLYRNGAKVSETADKTGSVENFENLFIGNCRDLNATFAGSLDEFRIYNYALSDAEISELYTLGAVIPGKVTDMLPANLSANLDTTNVTLSWKGNAASYNIYAGLSAQALELRSSNVTATSYDLTMLSPNTNYYWRIDAVNGSYSTAGDVFSFTTKERAAKPASGFSPANLAVNVDTVNLVLSWTGGTNSSWYNVYAGTSAANLELKASKINTTTFTMPKLTANTTYYWRIDAGNSSSEVAGTVNSFTTKAKTVTGIENSETGSMTIYPNPFKEKISVQFMLAEKGRVTLQIADLSGKVIRTLVDSELAAGPVVFIWDGKNDGNEQVRKGIYFCILQTADLKKVYKIVYLNE